MSGILEPRFLVSVERALKRLSQGTSSVTAKGASGNVTEELFVRLCCSEASLGEKVSRQHLHRTAGGGAWAACAIKAEGGCRLVLPGVHTCAPFEQGRP